MSKEAMKLALEALEEITDEVFSPYDNKLGKAITALREALAEQPAQQDSTCSNALRAQGKAYPRTCKKCGLGPCVELAQQALDKMADNARELGLDYEPAQQEPVATLWQHGRTGRTRITMPGDITDCDANWFKASDLYTSPPAQRTWVGLNEEDRDRILREWQKEQETQHRHKASDLHELNLPVRYHRCLISEDILMKLDLCNWTEREIKRIPNMGAKGFQFVKEAMTLNGLKFKGQEDA